MSNNDVDARLRQTFSAVFGIDESAIGDDDSPRTIESWDSVNHIHLILSLEAEFGVIFDAGETATLVTVGAIRRRLEEALADG